MCFFSSITSPSPSPSPSPPPFLPSLTKLRLAVAEAIGFSVHLCAADALDQQLPKLISGVVQLYKKHPDHYYVSQVGRMWRERKNGVALFTQTLLCFVSSSMIFSILLLSSPHTHTHTHTHTSVSTMWSMQLAKRTVQILVFSWKISC